MPRPRNQELSGRVQTALIHQLLDRGFTATSYASIARAAGTTRAVVQAYYPHKEDMARELSDIAADSAMEATAEAAGELPLPDEDSAKIAHLFLSGSAYFEFMQRDEGRRALLAELIRDRDQSEAVFLQIAERAFGEIERLDVLEDPAYRNDIIMSIGGLYELLYYHLKNGMHFDPALYYGQMTRVWMRDAGFTEAQVAEVLAQSATQLENLGVLVGRMEERFRERGFMDA